MCNHQIMRVQRISFCTTEVQKCREEDILSVKESERERERE